MEVEKHEKSRQPSTPGTWKKIAKQKIKQKTCFVGEAHQCVE